MKSSNICTLLGAAASYASFAYALTSYPIVDIDSRSLEEIYAVAKQENGPLQVFWGGDGELVCVICHHQSILISHVLQLVAKEMP